MDAPSARPLAQRLTLATLAAVFVLAAVTGVARAQDDADGLRRLAERLVGTWGDPGQMRVDLHVAELPPALAEVPVPDFELLGSVARYERDTVVSVQMLFDGPPRTIEALEALRATYEAEGWVFLAEDGMAGFMASQMTFFARACGPQGDGDARPLVYMNVSFVPAGASDVRLDYAPIAWEGACVPMERPFETYAPLPTLTAPEGATVSSPVMMQAPDDAGAAAILRGVPSLEDLAAHYHEQMAAQGWVPFEAPGPSGEAAATDVADVAAVRTVWTRVAAERRWVAVLALERPLLSGPVAASLSLLADDGP